MKVGDIVDLQVTKVSGYACWGSAEGKAGFSHIVDWSEEKPVPENCYPVVGQTIKMRVFHLTGQGEKLPWMYLTMVKFRWISPVPERS